MAKNTILTDDDFDKIYTEDKSVKSEVFDSEYGQVGMLETYGADVQLACDIANKTPKKVWTMVDSDEGMSLIAGYHLVNRIYYIITNEDWKDEFETYVFDDYGIED